MTCRSSALDGASTRMPGTLDSSAMSYTPWWLAPSGPVMPARSRQKIDRQAVQRDVVDHLVPGPVEERGVDARRWGADRPSPCRPRR